VAQAGKIFHVTPRTVRNWQAGKTRPPGAVLRLLRMMARFELPAPFTGWHVHSGKLWTPEGHAIEPNESSWWSLLVRQARGFRLAYAEAHQLRHELRRAWQAGYLTPTWQDSPTDVGDLPGATPGGAAAGLVSVSTTPTKTGESSNGAASGPVPPSGPGPQIVLPPSLPTTLAAANKSSFMEELA
jgi:hypothetical protein